MSVVTVCLFAGAVGFVEALPRQPRHGDVLDEKCPQCDVTEEITGWL